MMKITLLAAMFVCLVVTTASAGAPFKVSEVAPLDDLVLEVNEQLELLTKELADTESYDDKKGGKIRQSFGLLACLGQALAEHEGAKETDIQGAHLRDAALKFSKKSNYEEAVAAFEQVKLAASGKATGDASAEHPWNKLVNMHPMMEEINSRNSALLKVLRRPRGKAEEPMHATTWVVLGLAMKADTHEVKNDADLPKWHEQSDAFIEASVNLAEAIRAKDKSEGRKWFDAANNACDACHEVFQ